MNRFLPVVILSLFASCSGFVLEQAYRNADFLILRRVSRYVDMTSEQREFARERIRYHHAWHASRELPQYSSFLDGLSAQTDQVYSVSEVTLILDQVDRYRLRLSQRIKPDVIDFLLKTESDRIDDLADRLEESNSDIIESLNLSNEARFEERVENGKSFAEFWVGSLNSEQQQWLRIKTAQIPDLSRSRLEHRRARQAELIELLRNGAAESELEVFLNKWMIEPRNHYEQPYRSQLQRRDQMVIEAMAEFSQNLTEEQRKHLTEKMQSLAGDFNRLAMRFL